MSDKIIPVQIEVDGNHDDRCGRNCPFLRIYACQLFGEELDETVLPVNRVWNDCEPTMQRCHYCEMMTL